MNKQASAPLFSTLIITNCPQRRENEVSIVPYFGSSGGLDASASVSAVATTEDGPSRRTDDDAVSQSRWDSSGGPCDASKGPTSLEIDAQPSRPHKVARKVVERMHARAGIIGKRARLEAKAKSNRVCRERHDDDDETLSRRLNQFKKEGNTF